MNALRPFTLFCLLLAGLFLSGLAQAQTYYTDRATFDTENPGLSTEDFESPALAPPPDACLFDGPVDSTGDGTCFGPGDLLPGVIYDTDAITSLNMAHIVAAGFGGFPTQSLSSNNPDGSTILTFTDPSITAVGFDLLCLIGGGPTAAVEIFVDDSSIGSQSVDCATPTFFGVSAADAITQITILAAGADNYEVVDDVSFGTAPLPDWSSTPDSATGFDFGSHDTDTGAYPEDLAVTNAGTAGSTLTGSCDVTGSTVFSIDGDNTLGAGLAMDESANITVQCDTTDAAVQVHTGTMTCTHDGDGTTETSPTEYDLSCEVTAAPEPEPSSPGFNTGITFTNGYTGSVEVTLSCNSGVPLVQSFNISEDSGVNFVIRALDFEAPDATCDISLSGLDDGYAASVLANGEDTGSSCVYSGTPVADESAAFAADGINTCEIAAEPMASEFIVDVSWAGVDDPSISQEAAMMLSCSPAATDTGSDYTTVSEDVSGVGDNQYTLDFYPSTSGTTTCTVVVDQSSVDQAVEASVSCDDGDDVGFVIGDLEGGCEVTFTAFYEGIPTLSHYGMAIMALLMLGVGFVGFRRFV